LTWGAGFAILNERERKTLPRSHKESRSTVSERTTKSGV